MKGSLPLATMVVCLWNGVPPSAISGIIRGMIVEPLSDKGETTNERTDG